jgi:bacterioferritin-associated ferredoxin
VYVCLCNPITESEVRRCVREGARSLTDLQACLGVAASCGSCAAVAVSIVEDECARPGAASRVPEGMLPAAA